MSKPRPLLSLVGRRYLVIGGGQGMGEATCLLLAEAGADIAVLDRSAELASPIVKRVREVGRRGVGIIADVLDDELLRHAIDRAAGDLGQLDGIVTIVGRAVWAPLLEMTAEQWQEAHDINLRYAFTAAQHYARRAVEGAASGAIVFVASVDGIRSAPDHAGYGAAKAGLVNLVKSAAIEWAPHGIRVNAVAPGAIVSPRIPLRSRDDELALMRRVPAQARGAAEDIAGAVAFFLSDLASYVTGQTLAVDGGLTAVGPLEYDNERKRLGPREPHR